MRARALSPAQVLSRIRAQPMRTECVSDEDGACGGATDAHRNVLFVVLESFRHDQS